MTNLSYGMRAIGLAVGFLVWTGTAALALPRPVNVGDVGYVRAPQDVFTEKDFFSYADRRLYNIKEPSLWVKSRDPNTRLFRFLFLSADRNGLAIRVEFAGPEKARLIWKTFDGLQTDDWGQVIDEGELELTVEQMNLFDYELNRLNFWFLERDQQGAKDTGDLWLLEGAEYGKYHAVPRIAPSEGLLYNFETFLVRFAGLDEALVVRGRPVAAKETPEVTEQ
ncbi:MAG: hypothetical protein EP347_09275 [Alphaproteobacteria bacterium]|nr:MAG: hypothetical protein EP347_09275 [Alphaproteobacteria bacterium]